jgi:DNA helicase HerA-like ATPase
LESRIPHPLLRQKVQELFATNRVRRLSLSQLEAERMDVAAVVGMLRTAIEKGASGATNARIALERVTELMIRAGVEETAELRELDYDVRSSLLGILGGLAGKLTEKAGLKGEVDSLIEYLEAPESPESTGLGRAEREFLTPEDLASITLSMNGNRLSIVYVPEPDHARQAVARFINRLLQLKKTGGARARVLVVLDEAQEYIPDRTRAEDFTDMSNRAVEALLRQGRKYRAFCWLATQRVAHLNVSALQQLHSYFVSTLPRSYDRMVIADAFSLSYEILERTTGLETGEWLFVSYRATNQRNVPVFIRTPDNEEVLTQRLMPAGG